MRYAGEAVVHIGCYWLQKVLDAGYNAVFMQCPEQSSSGRYVVLS